jgi:hypothetical protein
MNPLKRRVTVGFFVVAMAAAACGGSSSSTSTSAKPARGFKPSSCAQRTAGRLKSPPPDFDTVVWVGDPLKAGCTTTLPGLNCPANFPYVLNDKFNTDTTFRLAPGIGFTYWNWGFDVNAQELTGIRYDSWPDKLNPYIATGVYPPSTNDNTATYYAFSGSTPWTMTLHCTSDPDKAVHQGNA